MPIHNNDIADIFNRTADLLELRGENPFRIRAYRNAARTIQSLPKNAAELISEGADLTKYPGIGRDLAGKIETIIKTGSFDVLDDLKKEVPEGVAGLMDIPGFGPKKAAKIYKEFNISSLDDLKDALKSGKVRELQGFGEKSERNILESLERLEKQQTKRKKFFVAEDIVDSLVKYLKKAKGVKEIAVAGSFRRRKETVKDLDILVTCSSGSNIMDHFTGCEDVNKVVSKGKTRSTVLLRTDFQVDVRVVPEISYGAALVYFTGSKEHNIAIRKIGIQKKLKVNEYGVFKGKQRVAGKTEAEVYKRLNLAYIEPELRENRGEVEAAQENKLPKLIKLDDIRGDLHVHSKYTDGKNTIEEIAAAAKRIGYSYMAITDHSEHVTAAGGLRPKEVLKEIKEIDKVNEKLKGITILKGTEVDILEDGKLDLPDDILEQLDVRVCAIHYKYDLSPQKQTERILRAMDNPYMNILAHPTGRLINERQAYDLDMERIIKAAKDRGCFLELNAHPDRLDLDDIYCKMGKDIGAKIVISTDSHQAGDLNFMRLGIGQARRGWLEAEDVLNTRSLNEVKKLLKRK